jgi:methionine-rich copper-binding protein CopC
LDAILMMRTALRRLVLAALLAWMPARYAMAHAFPSAQQPPAGSTLRQCPSEVAISFDAPVESLFAKMQVINEAGQIESEGEPRLSDDHHRLWIPLKQHLPPGDYTVKWSIVAEDGHRTEGSFSFTVADPGS